MKYFSSKPFRISKMNEKYCWCKEDENANTSLCRVQQDKMHCISNISYHVCLKDQHKYVFIQCLLHQKPIVVWGWFFNYTIYISIEKAFVSPCLLKDKMYCTRFIVIINHCKDLPHIKNSIMLSCSCSIYRKKYSYIENTLF